MNECEEEELREWKYERMARREQEQVQSKDEVKEKEYWWLINPRSLDQGKSWITGIERMGRAPLLPAQASPCSKQTELGYSSWY
jgi:hypothetical protein